MQAGTPLPISIYATTVFIASGLLMMLEILAGRLLAPYIGISLYTWTSIIGVILAGVSLGNWVGGVWSDRKGNERSVAQVLALCGTMCIAVLLILSLIAPYLQGFNLDALSASFIYVCILFFIPAFLIGIITPILTTLALRRSDRPGHIVGMMHALAAAGSIAGTFLAGYWLIQYFGTYNLIVTCGIVFYVLATPFILGRLQMRDTLIVLFSIVIVFLAYQRDAYTSPCKKESQYFCIRVVDASDMVPFGFANAMILDHLMHGVNHSTRPDMLVYDYLQAIDEIVKTHFQGEVEHLNYYFAGGGAYTYPRAVNALYPQAKITVAELDPMVSDIAKEHMNVDMDAIKVLHQDARLALSAASEAKYDVIVGDVYHDVTMPYHMTTRELFQLVKSRLRDGGLYTMNILDSGDNPKMVKSIYKTLQKEFRYVSIWLETNHVQALRQTYVISASDHRPLPETISATHGFDRQWRNVTEGILQNGTPLAALPVLTDDYAPVERLISALIVNY